MAAAGDRLTDQSSGEEPREPLVCAHNADVAAASGSAGPERRFFTQRKLAAVISPPRGELLESLVQELNAAAPPARMACPCFGRGSVGHYEMQQQQSRSPLPAPCVTTVVPRLHPRNEGALVDGSGKIRASIQGPHRRAATAAGESSH